MRHLFLALLVGLALPVGAQVAPPAPDNPPGPVRIGDKYFALEQYYQAAAYFQKALEENPDDGYAALRLGDAYRSYFNYAQAEQAYARALGGAYGPAATYWYGLMLKWNGKYVEAQQQLDRFLEDFRPTTAAERQWRERAVLDNNGATLALNEMQKPTREYHFRRLEAPLNTDALAEYAPAFWKHDSALVVTAARPNAKGKETDDRNGQTYSDLYRFEKDTAGRWQPAPDPDGFGRLNTIRNDGAGVFDADRTHFYYTSCWEGRGECYLYVSALTNGRWGKPVRLNEYVNYPGYDTKQPALSPGGDTLFFASDRPGGFGSNDLWYSVRDTAGVWQKAVNLGKTINTPYEEISPSYQPEEGALFFASNGHEGFGGLDVLVARGRQFEEVFNLGLPFNSARDDFYFVLGAQMGYLTSNRAGSDDLYRFDKVSRESLIASVEKDSIEQFESVTIAGRIVDEESNQPLPDVEVQLNRQNEPFKTTVTDEEGLFQFKNLPADTSYRVVVDEGELADRRRQLIDTVGVVGSSAVASRLLFENVYFDFDADALRPEARQVLDEIIAYAAGNPAVQIEMNANTDNVGSDEYNDRLSTRRGEAARRYLIDHGLKRSDLVIDARGESNPLVSNVTRTGRQLNRRVEFYVIGGPDYVAGAMAYVTQPGDALPALARRYGTTPDVLRRLNQLPDGPLEAYRPLRVPRTGNYVVAPETMVTTQPPDLKNGYYLVEEGMTLFSVARMFGLTVERLKALNQLDGDVIYVGQKLKVGELTP